MTDPNPKPPGRPTARQALLDAAIALIKETGTGHLTLEAVAQRAGVSKGGLLYHFPNKSALLEAMIEAAVCEETAQLMSDGPKSVPDRQIVARLFRMRSEGLCEGEDYRIAQSMLGAIIEEPRLLDPVRKLQSALWRKIRAISTGPERLWLLWLALEGLMFADMFQVNPLSPEERTQMVDRLLSDIERELGAGAQERP